MLELSRVVTSDLFFAIAFECFFSWGYGHIATPSKLWPQIYGLKAMASTLWPQSYVFCTVMLCSNLIVTLGHHRTKFYYIRNYLHKNEYVWALQKIYIWLHVRTKYTNVYFLYMQNFLTKFPFERYQASLHARTRYIYSWFTLRCDLPT